MISGTDTLTVTESSAEITNISPNGIWVLSNDREYFINYKEYPFFTNASIRQIADVEKDSFGNLHWPELDIDIELEALENPEEYPLIYNESSGH